MEIRFSKIFNIKTNSTCFCSVAKDFDKILGLIVYETAKNIYYLHSLLFDNDNMTNWESILDESVVKAYKKIPQLKRKEFIGELSRQHYKLFEQVREKELYRGFTKQEEMILMWRFCNSEYLARIFTESIKRIEIIDKENCKITFHFWNEIITKKIRGRTYDDKNIKMIFTKVKLEV